MKEAKRAWDSMLTSGTCFFHNNFLSLMTKPKLTQVPIYQPKKIGGQKVTRELFN